MAVTNAISRTEGDIQLAKEQDGSDSIVKSRKPEGGFELFIMDFDISGTNKSLYPAIIKSYRGTRGDKLAKNANAADYLAARYAIGRARSYILEALGIPKATSAQAAEFTPLTPGKYEKLVLGTAAAAHDPEKTAIVIDTGKPIRIGISGVLQQTGVVGQTQNVGIVGPIQLRIPTAVTVRQFLAWISSAKGPANKQLLSYIALAGGRQVPITGGASQPQVLIDGSK